MKRLFPPVCAVAFLCLLQAEGRSCYLSSSSGSDAGDGTAEHPWKTLKKISAATLAPGDEVRFKRGDQFIGHFVVNGSGSPEKPIRIGAYGKGTAPILTGCAGPAAGGDFQEAILVRNHDNLVFEGLCIENERRTSRAGVDDEDAYGIHVHNSGSGPMRNLVFRNLEFRNIYAVKPMLKPEDFDGLEVAGLRIASNRNQRRGKETNIQNVLVENCRFSDIQRLGIHIKHGGAKGGIGNDVINRNANIVVRNNEFHHLGGTCVLPMRTFNCLIENNLFDHPGSNADPRMPHRGSSVWTWRCINTVIQHNTCLSTRGYLDSHGIHIDHENVNTFVQYNYMEDCEGGFVEILGGNSNAVYRFNISVNDGWRRNPKWKNSNHTIWISPTGAGKKRNLSSHSYIYNNTVFIDRDFTTAIAINARNTYIFNNIFCSTGRGEIGRQEVRIENNGTPLFMRNNLFYGRIDPRFIALDQNPVQADPRFQMNGSRAERFRLRPNSPAPAAGTTAAVPPIPGAGTGIFKNLTACPETDFFGQPLNTTPVVGAGK